MDSLQACLYATLGLGVLPMLVWLLLSWNELRFITLPKLHHQSSISKLPPGNMGFPIVGELVNFLWYFKIVGRPDDFINSKRKRYGDGAGLYRTHLFGSPSIIGCTPSFNKFVLQSPEEFGIKWPSAELVGYNSVAIVDGPAHTRLRGYITNTINRPDALKKVTDTVQEHIVYSLRSWANKGKINGLDEIRKITFENICNMFVSFKPGPTLDMIEHYFDGLFGGFRAQPVKIPGTAYYHAIQCRKKLLVIFRKELERRRKFYNRETNNDLMEGLMRMIDEQGKLLSDDEVVDNIVALVIAGYESTSLSVKQALYYLARHPDVVKKLQDENFAVGRKGDLITSEELRQLKYTSKVVNETIRLANISAFVFRAVKKDVTYQGYIIPKGWNVIVWLRYLHTDPRNFEDPMCFNPDRWDEPPKPNTYQVFGKGPRICAGDMLAKVQITIFLHHLVTGYKWELINPDVKMVYLPNPKPADGLEIMFTTI